MKMIKINKLLINIYPKQMKQNKKQIKQKINIKNKDKKWIKFNKK